ncbi:ferrochelatase hem15 [Mucor velutinosus]|uniref:Ferrochelatase hem15 n=1 Tax=Mucor velutinosus TaxID=708070 RepID=A0AAN7HKU3_9FUNG|nr:ferrochelatase hem15 [Mucor velutinosus]
MSRFTEHFDIETTTQFMYNQSISSPSKTSFFSMSSSESSSPVQQYRSITVDTILTQSLSSFDSECSSSPTSYEEDKPSKNKLKRFLTTMSKKKRSMSNHSQ